MLRMFKNKKAQNTAEYAILIALVIGGVVAMQTYAQRALQARLRDAAVKFRDETNAFGNTLQYEPYYSNTSTEKDTESTKEATRLQDNSSKITYTNGVVDRVEYNANAIQGYCATTGF